MPHEGKLTMSMQFNSFSLAARIRQTTQLSGRRTQLPRRAACLLLAISASACLSLGRAADAPGAASASKVIRVACVGDSITYGSRIEDRTMTYPAQLGRLLGPDYRVTNFGVSGATMLRKGNKPYDQQKACAAALADKPDIVVLMLGTNDSKETNWAHKAEFAADCKALLEAFRLANPNVHLYVCLPVPAFPGNYGIRDGVIRDAIIPVLRQVAGEERASLIDCYTALSGKGDLFPDKVHPNAEGAGLMAATIFQALTGKQAPSAAVAR
jgi:acyl-CoA thioesterase I